MSRPHLMSDAAALTARLLDRGETLRGAAKSAGLSPDTLVALIRRDKAVSFKTAAKLKKYFGNDVVRIHTEPAQM